MVLPTLCLPILLCRQLIHEDQLVLENGNTELTTTTIGLFKNCLLVEKVEYIKQNKRLVYNSLVSSKLECIDL